MSGRVVARLGPVANVKCIERDVSGNDTPARKGLHVYLAAPSTASDSLLIDRVFTHFTIGDAGALLDLNGAPVSLDRGTNHWCYWATSALDDKQVNRARGPLNDLDHRAEPVDGAFDIADGRGFAPPTEWKQDELVLPGPKALVVNVFDLFTRQDTRVKTFLDEGARFWHQVLIEITFNRVGTPPGLKPNEAAPWKLFSGKVAGEDVTLVGKDNTSLAFNFAKPPFQPATDPARSIALVVTDELSIAKAKAFALLTRPISHMALFKTNFTRPSKNALVFFPVIDTAGGGASNVIAHELGHCLLHDPGIGKNHLDTAALEKRVRDFLADLACGATFEALFQQSHLRSSGALSTPEVMARNLMVDTGGSLLVPWQIAVARAAHELTPRTMAFGNARKPAMPDP